MAPAASDKAEQAGKKSAVKEEAASDVEDDDEEDDDVSCATRFPSIFARIPHHEPIPALPDVSNPPRIGRARVGAANSALRTAFTGVESSICYFLSSYEPRETARLLPSGTASLTARVSLRPPIDSAQGVKDEEDVHCGPLERTAATLDRGKPGFARRTVDESAEPSGLRWGVDAVLGDLPGAWIGQRDSKDGARPGW